MQEGERMTSRSTARTPTKRTAGSKAATPQKFIAVRRNPHTLAAHAPTTAAASVDTVTETRTALVAAAQAGQPVNELQALGLKVLDPCEEAREGGNSLWPLCYLDAYVVEAADPQLAEQARQVLAPDYLLVPNAEMYLAAPQRGDRYSRIPRDYTGWPQASGVPLAHKAGITGQGAIVCVLDTGVDADHRELRRKVIDFRYIPLDPKSGAMRASRGFDSDGHGTHVCGIIAGENVGVAPGVELMVASVLESETLRTSLERVVVALNWVLSQFEDPARRDKPVIVNMSLGFTQAQLDHDELESPVRGFQQVLTTLLDDFHVLPIVAVGNEGPGNVRAPAYFADTLSVGAVDFDHKVAEFSGSGKSPISNEREPNLVGYGVDVLSSYERTTANRSVYRRMSGTSMASPYVAGIAALHASCQPALQGRALWNHLVATALPIDDQPDRAGAGLARFQEEQPA